MHCTKFELQMYTIDLRTPLDGLGRVESQHASNSRELDLNPSSRSQVEISLAILSLSHVDVCPH